MLPCPQTGSRCLALRLLGGRESIGQRGGTGLELSLALRLRHRRIERLVACRRQFCTQVSANALVGPAARS
ncbi:hypothetical protein AWV80_33350 [Cupriavidus sp. UYMU48A]|nr:hypothetical protein AWV80_33350 [Cupriavidus sp. UYMU48A]